MQTIVWTEAALSDLGRLDRRLGARIHAAIERLALHGHGDVKQLKGTDDRRLRVGDWRVRLAHNQATGTITILRVLPRGSAYQP